MYCKDSSLFIEIIIYKLNVILNLITKYIVILQVYNIKLIHNFSYYKVSLFESTIIISNIQVL